MPTFTVTYARVVTYQAEKTIRARDAEAAGDKAQDYHPTDAEWEVVDETEDIESIDAA